MSTATATLEALPELAREQITAIELQHCIKRRRKLQIIDVREPHEFARTRIPHARLIPLGQIVDRQSAIDPTIPTVVFCKAGTRSARAIAALKDAGFTGHLINLQGGILAWSKDVDPRVPLY